MKKQTKAAPAFDFSCCALIIAEYTDCMKMKKKKPILISVDTTYIKIATYNTVSLGLAKTCTNLGRFEFEFSIFKNEVIFS